MFKIESYVTPILLSYVDKYVRDFKPADAQVSLWGGGVALHNLVIKADVLQKEVALPFTLVSGRIHELLIQVPWTKIMSEPIVVTIDTIECVLSLNPPATADDPPAESPSRKTQVVETPPGYMQALVRRIVSNIALRVHHLIVKYVQDDIVMSLNVKHLAVDSAGINWEPAFADIDQNHPVIRRLVRLDDLTLCLDKSDDDGKIRFFQEPLLYRCQLDLRVLTRLMSANTRRAVSLNVQLRSVRLAWSISNDQLLLLLRLIRERPVTKPQSPAPKQSVSQAPMHTVSSNSAEPARSESWSDWAWSWLPTWMDREGGVEEAPVPATPLPVFFSAFLNDITLVFKVMEMESMNRKRSRSILEVNAKFAALKSSICTPTSLRVRFGARDVIVRSQGKCVCGHINFNSSNDEPTDYLKRVITDGFERVWSWPEEDLNEKVETAEAVDETFSSSPTQATIPEGNAEQSGVAPKTSSQDTQQEQDKREREETEELWKKMTPLVFVEYNHERSPPTQFINPYDNPPKDFEYSDWVEECNMMIQMEPIEIRMCMGLLHRLNALKTIYGDQPLAKPEQQMRVLTIEENEALAENLPQKRISIEAHGLRIRVIPWNHVPADKSPPAPVVLEFRVPKISAAITAPMYPHRVCSAACQMPEDRGPLYLGARRHITLTVSSLQAHLLDPVETEPRPCARADLRLVTHQLLNKEYFDKTDSVQFAYHLKFKELSISGSSARLQTAFQVLLSLYNKRRSLLLKHTTIVKDALTDEEAVAIDLVVEDFVSRGYITRNVNTHVVSLQSAKATAFHAPKGGELKQAWLFSAPGAPSSTSYLRMAIQWCKEQLDNSVDYLCMWTQPLAMSVDPLLIAYLAYKPALKPDASASAIRTLSTTQNFMRRRPTPPSSSGRGVSRTGSGQGAELVHGRSRSHGSGSEPSEKKEYKPPIPIPQKPPDVLWSGENLVALHNRLRTMLINIEVGLVLVYVTMSTASAIDCATLRDAMERHASEMHRVLAISLGRLTVNSSSATKGLWSELRHDGPTYVKEKMTGESFPWKVSLADVSCYTLEVRPAAHDVVGQERTGASAGLKSKLRVPQIASPRTVLELVTTSITISVVTKSIQYKSVSRKDLKKPQELTPEENRTKYFTSGTEFKPTTLKEFVRGPSDRKPRDFADASATNDVPTDSPFEEVVTIVPGPVVSLGVHLHADTPPLIIRLERDQIHIVAAAVHCFTHIHTLLKRDPVCLSKQGYSSLGGSYRSLIRSVSEVDEIQSPSETTSDTKSDLISLFDRSAYNQRALKTFYWFQWVVSRATLVVASRTVKLALDIDDIISTVDVQAQYNQLKLKLASASIKHYERIDNDEWSAGVMGGRVLEAREPADAKADAHFLSVTITQALIENLPASWKEEMHPKLLETNSSVDSMWEIYATLAPLEALVQPAIMDNVMSLAKEMAPRAFCPLKGEIEHRMSTWQWPFCYIAAGGVRLLVTGDRPGAKTKNLDDTFIFSVGQININPHPDNPICRRAVNAATDGGWLAASGGFEGRQYEIVVKDVSMRSSNFSQLALVENPDEYKQGTASENPALKWSSRHVTALMVPILHTVELCSVLAPALYMGGTLACGPALELNLVSDCGIELSIAQLVLLKKLTSEFIEATRRDSDQSSSTIDTTLTFDKHGVCPYATLIMKSEMDIMSPSNITLVESAIDSKISFENDGSQSVAGDSGVETVASSTKTAPDDGPKKTMSVAFVEQVVEAAQYLEVFVTMGVIDVSLYVADDNSPEVIALRPPHVEQPEPAQQPEQQPVKTSSKEEEDKGTRSKESVTQSQCESRSLTEMVRENDAGQTLLDIPTLDRQARKNAGNVTLMQITLFQPNLYYWKRKALKTLQLSLFNAWIALGVGDIPGQWHAVLMATAQGVSDPVTDIPPALATLKVVAPIGSTYPTTGAASSSSRGTIRLDIEKPVQVDFSTDKLMRLKNIHALLEKNLLWSNQKLESKLPILYKWRSRLTNEGIESITIQSSQISVCGSEGTVGWDSASLQVSASTRPDRLNARSLITALLVAAGPPGDRRHVVLQPLTLGMELEATWEAWRRAESGVSAREPCVKVGIELDHVVFDLRPTELMAVNQLCKAYNELLGKRGPTSAENVKPTANSAQQMPPQDFDRRSSPAFSENEFNNHYYKDDLRSGAFKISSGGQLPMAYQVVLHGNAVSWRYPHPRAITRLVAFPLPGLNTEIDCVLELYTEMLGRWEPHTYFRIPLGEPRELNLYVPPPDAVFAIMWRFRACAKSEKPPQSYEFNINRFTTRSDPLVIDHPQEQTPKYASEVTAEQLSGVLRVDSYFSPRLYSHNKILLRVGNLHVHIHNSLPHSSGQVNSLEGYYVSKPLKRTHRVLSLTAQSTTVHAQLGSPAGVLYILDTNLACDIVDCATGTMEQIVEQFRVQSGISVCKCDPEGRRARVFTSGVHVALQIPRLRTLQALAADWNAAYKEYICESTPDAVLNPRSETKKRNKEDVAAAMARALEGRVSLWIHNSCASAIRAGQEGTDEVVPLGPGARLAYRWRSPTAPKRLRLALAGPTADWHWSSSLPFTPGTTRLRLETTEPTDSKLFPSTGAYVHVKIEEFGASRYMHLSGRLVLANMLRSSLLYKVRAHSLDSTQWRTVCSGELSAETVDRSVVCNAECEMVLKIRYRSHNTGWSGDIPLKECPKENVPWLVKVPTEGDMQFVSVWCRVVRARSDGRVLATLWPLYVLHSHLPLDTDVLIATEPTTTTTEDLTPVQLRQAPALQVTPGRGTSTHLKAPGTTAAKHSLSFQYRNIECPVTREAVPLHYGVTDTSVFDKRTPVTNIEDVIKDILQWLERSGHNAISTWPYSLVSKHWNGEWQPASLQPRCDVNVRYQAVRAGGGCSLEISLCPVALLCNATTIPLTLRAHDAVPLCKLESGTAISPPSAILTKPFFMSVEVGRETYVSSQLQVSAEEPGRYGSPPPGHVALDHAAHFSILCNQKVALLTLHYEIKEQINVLGVTSTYMLINRLNTDLLVSAIAVPNTEEDALLRPKTFKLVQPTKEGSIYGTPLCRFWLRGRWRGGDVNELHTYLCLALSGSSHPTRNPVPIRLGVAPVRRAVSLIDSKRRSIPIVVSQMRHDSRCVVVVAHDPCPQFVVHNHTQIPFAVAQPLHLADEPSTSHTEATPECAGARWSCIVPPDFAIHYSTPAHCARYPPQASRPLSITSSNMPFLTFARAKDESELIWCAPVAAADGEQLLQYFGGVTIKLRVRTNPHSTLLELQDVDHTDLSASDIRRRLFGALASAESETSETVCIPDTDSLQRTSANSRLLRDSTVTSDRVSIEAQQLDPSIRSKVTLEDEANTTNMNADSASLADRTKKNERASTVVLFANQSKGKDFYLHHSQAESKILHRASDVFMSQTSFGFEGFDDDFGDLDLSWAECERFRCVISSIAVEMAAAPDVQPLLALHLDRTALLVLADDKITKTILSIADAQIDNLQYESGQFDFAVVASTRAEALEADHWPPLWNMFAERDTFATRQNSARLLLNLQHDMWDVVQYKYKELTEVVVKLGTLALYVEDAYVKALVDLSRLLVPAGGGEPSTLSEERSLQTPLRLRLLHVQPLDLTLTLHTAVRMYIALDQSPLRLSAFKLHDMMTSSERLTHALTVHYLSAAILGAGWVVGGLELLGAPGALAARVGGATGGVRAVASAAAAALLRSLSAWAGSLARNLDLLAGDEEHARRAAAARRRPPPSFIAGLMAGITNFAINILGAVGGLAHHPLVGVAVGETESGAAALRRGLLGALTKPLSATADLVAYAGTGLLRQTGWDPVPEPRRTWSGMEPRTQSGWQRDCVRWTFRLCELTALAGFEVLLDNAPLQLLLTHKFLVVADPETERIVEMIDLRFCTLEPYRGQIIELCVTQKKQSKIPELRITDEDDEYQISAAAMARVARYTGAEGSSQAERRVLSLLPPPGRSYSLHAALAAALHHNADSHFPML